MSSVVARVTPGFVSSWYESWSSQSTAKKMAVRLLFGIVFLALAAVVIASPAEAASNSAATVGGLRTGPVDDIDINGWSTNNWNYLMMGRWDPVMFSPSGFLGFGSVVTYAPYLIQVFLTSVLMMIARVFIFSLTLVSGGGLIANTADKIDQVFAKIGNGILGNDGGGFSGSGALILSVLLGGLIALAGWRLVRGGVRAAGTTFLGGIFAVALLMVMSSGASSNVDRGATAGGNGPSPAFGSPSWIINGGGTATAFVGEGLQSVMTAMADSLDQTSEGSQDECERYIDALHYTYQQNSGSSSAASVVTSFDALMAVTLLDNVRIASMGGDTESSNSSWCRFSEMSAGAPMIDQVQLSRTAGLYSDIVGYSSAQAMPSAKGGSAGSGSAVTGGGEFTSGGDELAANIFGPEFPSGQYADRAIYFWAACGWNDSPGSSVRLNPEWAEVNRSYATDESVWDALRSAQESPWSALGPLGTGVSSIFEYFSRDAGSKTVLGDGADSCGYVVENGLTDDEGGETGSRSFQYGEKYSLIGTLTNWNVSSVPLFSTPVQQGDTAAYDSTARPRA